MKSRIINFHGKGQLMALLLIVVAALACQKEGENEAFVPSRYFAPGGITLSAPNVTVTLQWSRPLYVMPSEALTYTVEVAADNTFRQIEKSIQTESNTVVFTNTDLAPLVTHVARIRVNAGGDKAASIWSISEPFSLTAP